MRKDILLMILAFSIVCSCTVDVIYDESNDEVNSVSFICPENVVWQNSTRLVLNDDNNNFGATNLRNYYENGDTIGIFPSNGDQIPFVISSLTAPSTSFMFTGSGWGLKTTEKYYAYTPFNRNNYEDANNAKHVNFSYFGQVMPKNVSLRENVFNVTDSVYANYSYMYSSATTAPTSTSSLTFKFYNLGGFIRISALTATGAPISTDSFILAKIIAKKPIFCMEGTYNLVELGDRKTTAELAGNSASAYAQLSDFTPSKRGLTNVLAFRLDSIKTVPSELYAAFGMRWYGLYLFAFAPPCDIVNNPTTLYLYTPDCKYWYGDLSFAVNPINGNTTATYATIKYGGIASPDSLEVEPWISIKEDINSNWNYK